MSFFHYIKPMSRSMRWGYFGPIEYSKALALQARIKQALDQGSGTETLLMLEHPPVITMGRSGKEKNVLVSEEERRSMGVDYFQVERGGDVTYHGPGQLVGYPIRRVDRNVKEHVRAMVDCIVDFLARQGITARWREDKPGVWCDEGKIAAVGVDARGGIAMHGFAFNVCPDLSHFDMIVPCGLIASVTSLQALLGKETPSVEKIAIELGPDLVLRYGSRPIQMASLQELVETAP
jgi:lipoyl(octanoyl) transferase